jgi:predicted dehydrogenase
LDRTIKVGVIGGGFGRNHILAFQVCDNVEVTAFCQRTQSSAEEIAREFRIPNVFTDYRQLLALKELDAISISAPPHLHCPMALEAFSRGLHVLCEKPLAMNVQEAAIMLAKAQASNRIHMTAFNFRFIPALRRMKELLEEGYVGNRIFHLDATWLTEMRMAPGAHPGWRFSKETAGIGALGDTGVHLIDLVRWLAADFSRVCGHAAIFNRQGRPAGGAQQEPVTVEDSCVFMAELKNGAQATIHASGVARGSIFQSIRIFGNDGVLSVDIDRKGPDWAVGKLFGAQGERANLQPLAIPEKFLQGLNLSDPTRLQGEFIFSHLTRRFVHAIRTGEEAAPTFHEGVEAQIVIDAVLKSVEEERWVQVV